MTTMLSSCYYNIFYIVFIIINNNINNMSITMKLYKSEHRKFRKYPKQFETWPIFNNYHFSRFLCLLKVHNWSIFEETFLWVNGFKFSTTCLSLTKVQMAKAAFRDFSYGIPYHIFLFFHILRVLMIFQHFRHFDIFQSRFKI